MKRLLVLGAGTAGTMAVNKLRPQLPRDEWSITVVDSDDTHYYQPGYLFVPFGIYRPDEIVKPKKRFIPTGVDLVLGEVDKVVPEDNKVLLVDGTELGYDYLIIASGTTPRPEETPGMADDLGGDVHEFYTFKGATALAEKLRTWEGGRLVVHITEMPIKCPVAPLEFTFLADAFFAEQGMRDKVEIVYVTPLEGAFTKPVASKHLGDMLETRGIALEGDFMVESIDSEAKKLISFDEREVPYDLLVTIPLNMGADFIARSGLGDDLNYVPVDKQTLLSDDHDNIFVVGRRLQHPGLQGRFRRPLRDGPVPGELHAAHQGPEDDRAVRRPRQLLHRDRPRQGPAHRLQLRHRAADRQVPTARGGPVLAAEGDRDEPLGQGHVPVDVLEHPAARQGAAAARAHVDGRQGREGPLMTETTHMGPDTVGALSPAAATVDSNAAILARLDAMSAQMAVMAEQVAEAAAAREQWSELVETLIPVSRGAMDVATRELSELEADVTIDDVTRFARTTARAIPDMEVLVGQIGSISELGHEVSSLGGAGMAKLTEVLQVAEDKGYFMFAREGAAIADRVVTTYTEDDVRALGDNVITILNAVKELTQPEVMAMLNRTALTIQEVEDTHIEPPSAFALLKSMRDPQTRRGLARVLSMLHTVGEDTQPTSPTK